MVNIDAPGVNIRITQKKPFERKRPESPISRFQPVGPRRFERFSRQRQFLPKKRYARIQNTVVRNFQRLGQGGGSSSGRGRPSGTYKYYIPGVGKVGVYQWRKYIRTLRNTARSQIQQNIALQQARQQALSRNPNFVPQQFQQQVPQYPQQPIPVQYPVQQVPRSIPVVQPNPYKEISIMERNALNMGNNDSQQFVETDLMSGQRKVSRIGNLW